MKINIGKVTVERKGVEFNWEGMTIEMEVKEVIDTNEVFLKSLPTVKTMLNEAIEKFIEEQEDLMAHEEARINKIQEHEKMMEATRHANAMELETLRHDFEMDLRDVKKVDSAGIGDNEWSEDDDDDKEEEDWTRHLKVEEPHEAEKKPAKRKSKK